MVSAARMSRRSKTPAAAVPAAAVPGTFTLFPTSESGYIGSGGSTYSVARAGTGFVGAYPGSVIYGGQYFTAGGSYSSAGYELREGFLSFDTSGVVGTITSATLSLGLSYDGSSVDFIFQARVRDWGATLTNADWVPGADLGALTLAATFASSGIGAAGAYKAMTENGSNLRTAINRAGFTRLVCCSDRTVSDTPPNNVSEEYMYFDYWDGALKPKLVVVTT